MPRCSLICMGTSFYFKVEVPIDKISIQLTQFEQKSIVTFISEEFPYYFVNIELKLRI